MLAALPADASIVMSIDVRKLESSPLAQRAWEIVRANDKLRPILDSFCGAEKHISSALASIDATDTVTWAWFVGLSRNMKLDCSTARERAASHPHRHVAHGDYDLWTSDEHVDETLWIDELISFSVVQKAGSTPIGEQGMRNAIAAEAGLTSKTRMGALLDHVDFESGAVFAMDGARLKQPGQRASRSVRSRFGERPNLRLIRGASLPKSPRSSVCRRGPLRPEVRVHEDRHSYPAWCRRL